MRRGGMTQEEKWIIYDSRLKVHGSCLGKRPEVERMMKQDERWNLRYQEVMDFITANRRNPSKHRIEEHDMLNWVKANRKLMNKGEMKEERVEKFKELLAKMEEYKRKNQYA